MDKILSLEQLSKKRLQDSKIIILNLIERLDNDKVALTVKQPSQH